jgi:two-component sensor histidine kinase/CheY-like chemotaxis protein
MPNRVIRVLYVDDDPGLARLAQKALVRHGYDVEVATDGARGMRLAQSGEFDVIALDHHLPDGTGLDLLARLREMPSAPAVVYVTASADTAVAISALKAGAFDYVPKSIADDFLELLINAVKQAAERTRLVRAKERVEQELREAKDRAEMLLREVNHRVANSLAMVAALVRMQAHAVDDPAAKAALAETQARISAVAGVHRRLYNSDDIRFVDIDEYLRSLMNDIDLSIGDNDAANRLRLQLSPVRVSTDKAVSIGVIAAELVTNALKYAYGEGESGEVRVILNLSDDGACRLAVEDDGIGYSGIGKPQGTGLGSRIINTMAATLSAELRYEPRDRGTRVVLAVPPDS